GFSMLAPTRTLHRIAVSLADLVEEALVELGLDRDGSIHIVRDYAALPPVFVNPGQIVQVLTNLIQNACQAMPNGGTLSLCVHPLDEQPRIHHVEISICDTGSGIPLSLQHKVFEPFFTTKQGKGGRGMGLTIARAMVERHGGTLRIHSPVEA